MQNTLWILYILVFIIAAGAGLKVSFDPNGENVQHVIVSAWFYPSLIACFLIAFGFKKLQAKEDDKPEDHTTMQSSPDTYLNLIVITYPADGSVSQDIIEKIQSICLQMADERFAYIQKYGIQKFSEFFEHFSHGERYLNRSWSALVDNHHQESLESFQTSQKYFEHALEKYNLLK
ncbi:MAG: hypothetical protein KC646_09950 [Candidatus Cloacimonetes bacterium]|nr:hypothetical protein [Candidatus Cloacimonadota bacterium]